MLSLCQRIPEYPFNGAFGPDVPVLFTKDDILVATDLTAHLFPELTVQLDFIRLSGAKVCFVVHDILPLRRPGGAMRECNACSPFGYLALRSTLTA